MTRPRWLRRAVRNRHRHAIEQAARRWRGVDAAIQDERAVNLISTQVNWVGGGSDGRTYLNGGGRDFRVNSDGTICLVNHPHLYLGVFDPENVDNYSGPRSDGLLSTDEISGDYSAAACACVDDGIPVICNSMTVVPLGADTIETWRTGCVFFPPLIVGPTAEGGVWTRTGPNSDMSGPSDHWHRDPGCAAGPPSFFAKKLC